jgi:uncharacterized protein (TIGR01777 family)
MRILIAGVGGLIGSAVAPFLAGQGHTMLRLVRRAPGADEVRWDPDAGTIDAAGLEGFDAVVHVASLPQAMWTPEFKHRMRANRIGATGLLAGALAGCEHKPGVLVCASGQGIYAPAGDTILTEQCPPGTDYLARVQREGEAATAPACDAGIRVVHLRLPTVVGWAGLRAFAPIIRRLGDGRQWFSWVARDELPSIVQHALLTSSLSGAVNAASPNPVRNEAFFVARGRASGRRPLLPLPAFVLRLMLGEMADALALASRRLAPRRLLETGYRFCFPEIEDALRHELAAQKLCQGVPAGIR